MRAMNARKEKKPREWVRSGEMKNSEGTVTIGQLGWFELLHDETCKEYFKPDDSERGKRWANDLEMNGVNLHIEMLRLNPNFPSILFVSSI
jgi:hypothetical protein